MIDVISSGLFSTIQDLGRYNYECFGVPSSGNMDKFSALLCNRILKNKDNCGVMEITMTGPKLKFRINTYICISGADMSPKINENHIKMDSVHKIKKGDILSFGKLNFGYRSYLAVKGGFLTKKILGSRSMFYPVTNEQKIKKGDEIYIDSFNEDENFIQNFSYDYNDHFEQKIIFAYEGPEYCKLSQEQIKFLTSVEFTISNSNNRMAYQLNELLKNNIKPIITSLVLTGTVQLTPSGKLIILMRDNQTCGGYPRILQLNEESINRLSQKHSGKKIKFQIIDY